jgi:hypothetical protein
MAGQHFTTYQLKQDSTIQKALNLLEEQIKQPKNDSLNNPAAVRQYLTLALGKEEQEVLMVLFLDIKNRLIESEILFKGTLTQISVYPREVVKKALLHNAAAVVLAHNHPSGEALPSNADKDLTNQLKNALELVDVKVLDHIVVAGSQTYSFLEHGILNNFSANLEIENKDFEKELYTKHIVEMVGCNKYGTGVGNYIDAIATDNKDLISSYGANVGDSAFTSLATIGKLIAYADMKELQSDMSNLGWLIVTLAELGSNASFHSSEAEFIQHRVKELS